MLRHFVQLRRRIAILSCVEWLLLRRQCLAISPRLAGVIASEAKQSMEPRKERMDCFVASLLAMTTNIGPRSRRGFAREFYLNLPPLISEGAGNAGRSMHPQSRV